MSISKTFNRKKVLILVSLFLLGCMILIGRIIYLMIFQSSYYTSLANDLHERKREIKAARGRILDRNGKVLATNRTVCTISVIYSQMREKEKIIQVLTRELKMDENEIRKKVEKVSSREKIKSNVEKEVGDRIRSYHLAGVKIDEDYRRYYLHDELASKVLGFTGADNQGILGLEVKYDKYLQGKNGQIRTITDAAGIEIEGALETRRESVAGMDLTTTLDLNIQTYAQQIAKKTLEEKKANYVSIIVMNPQNGEIYAMVNAPEFNLNQPYELNVSFQGKKGSKEYQNELNKMWRNQSINDTYEPGSTFKIFTATTGLEEHVVTPESTFSCPGYKIVDDRRIRCHKTTGHGTETFVQGTMNSCNPVFMTVGERIGVNHFYEYFQKLGLCKNTGVDLPGEAGTILHKKEKVGAVELATMSFGQSFQITPIHMLQMVSCVINGGTLVTPHFGISAKDTLNGVVETFSYDTIEDVVSKNTSKTMRMILEKVVSEGSGKKGEVEGFRVGGKTATSQKLPRSANKYIASFIGFAPADHPEVIAIAIIDEPQGIYYGGTVAAPVIQNLYQNILPYLLDKK